MGHSYKGSAVPFKFTAAGQPPYLVAQAGTVIVWYYQGPEPDFWGVYDADDVQFGDELDLIAGSGRRDANVGAVGTKLVVRGVDSLDSTWQTKASNSAIVKA